MKKFNDNFIFGAASAAYQVEGAFETDGKQVSNWDTFSKIEGKTFEATNGDVAVDHFHRYKEDVQLMKEMGLESYRFSFSWSRIIKEDGSVNEKGVEFYNNLIDELIANGIKPFATLYHWDLPNHLEERGGWSNELIVDDFVNYANVCFDNFADRVVDFITFNEAIVFCALGYLLEAHPPGVSDPALYYKATHNVNMSHAKAVLDYKAKYDGKIGITHVLSPVYPGDQSASALAAKKWVELDNFYWYYDPILKGSYPEELYEYANTNFDFSVSDADLAILAEAAPLNNFIGINYYQPSRVVENESAAERVGGRENSTGGAGGVSFDGKTRSVVNDDCTYTKWGWETYPRALYDGMKKIQDEYGAIEIIITENGLGDVDVVEGDRILDQPRIDYISDHLKEVHEAAVNGINITGYFAWSFTDLLSWLNGYKKQYGFVYVDHNKDLERRKKDSYFWYQEVIATRGSSILED